ncbi:MAG TPA: hypothetical protein PLD05_06465 [Thermogutta sp.]|nr:hypothetical protein [Thermogutta sp.]
MHTKLGEVEAMRWSICWCLVVAISLSMLVSACQHGGLSDSDRLKQAAQQVQLGYTDRIDMGQKSNIGDQDLELLAAVEGLHFLRVDGSRITDEGLAYLVSQKELIDLYASNTRLSDEGLKILSACSSLETLVIDKTQVTDAGLAYLAELPNLRRLSLWKCFITDDGCRHLAKLPQLQVLSLDETLVTDAGMKYLTGLKNLRRISLWKTRVSDQGVAILRSALPDLEINR